MEKLRGQPRRCRVSITAEIARPDVLTCSRSSEWKPRFDKLPDDATSAVQKRRYYQTTVRGLSNQGHQFAPQGLSDEDKRALIEYLKTL